MSTSLSSHSPYLLKLHTGGAYPLRLAPSRLGRRGRHLLYHGGDVRRLFLHALV